MRRAPRVLRWLMSVWTRTFWLPCPICGENFGGWEPDGGRLYTSPGAGKMTCPKQSCIVEAERRNLANRWPRFSELTFSDLTDWTRR